MTIPPRRGRSPRSHRPAQSSGRSKPAQLSLIPRAHHERPDHGGELATLGRRKGRRPLDPKRPIHLVLKSSRARGEWSFLHRRNRATTERFLYGEARRRGLTVLRLANVGNHLHLLVKTPSRATFQAFLRTATCLLARRITGAKKGRPRGRFWDAPAYTRVIHWGRHYRALCAYLGKNRLEAVGFAGARLRLRADGEAVVVVGELTELSDNERADGSAAALEDFIRGG
ncbi:MAG: hypothetical protein IT285_04380 [Bdellovibrionales bacterium]|nr:hypothetical protein [Bdellovibrionales bacterium]